MSVFRWLSLTVLVWQILGCTVDGAPPSFEAQKLASDGVIYEKNSIEEMPADEVNRYTVVSLFERGAVEALQSGRTYLVGEKFGGLEEFSWAGQPSASYCSGVLLSPRLVLTAGHCVLPPYDCENMQLVMNYYVGRQAEVFVVRNCLKISRTVSELADRGLDYAVIQLDTAVNVPSRPIDYSPSKVGKEIYTLGDPFGSFKKRATGRIRAIDDRTGVYETTLDVFEGNSGSPVFSKGSGTLIGILSSGENDFNEDGTIKKCRNNDCTGEFVIPMEKILHDYMGPLNKDEGVSLYAWRKKRGTSD